MKSKTLWKLIGLAALGLLVWIGLRAWRNHRRRETEIGEYQDEGIPK